MTATNRQSDFVISLLKPPFGMTWPAMAFALRTAAASLIALYIAFLLGFDDPKWAAMTVWIVAQGTRGTSLSKSQNRLIGTIIGAVVAVILTALFSQQPEIFLPALALWLGLCTALSTGLRNFKSYGAVLAGYTAVIVAMDSIADPQDIFEIAVSRVAYIMLGIVTEAAVTAIFAPQEPTADIRIRLGNFLRQSAMIGAQSLRGADAGAEMHRCFVAAIALDTAAEYGAAGSHELKGRIGYLRQAIVSGLLQATSARTIQSQLSAGLPPQEDLVGEVQALLQAISTGGKADPAILTDLRTRVAEAKSETAVASGSDQRFMLLHRLESLLTAVERSLHYAALLANPGQARSSLRFSFHIDHTAALLNGIRAFAAVLIAAAFSYATGWSSAAGFVIIVGVVIALFATRPNPISSGLGFLKGTFCAVLVAALCNFAVIPAISGFTPLALVLGTVMTGAGLAMRNPRTAAPAASFAIFFLDLVSPDNLTRTDASSFFNGALALTMGIGIGTLAFGVLIPANRQAIRLRLRRAVLSDLARIGRHPGDWQVHEWVSRIADRLALQPPAAATASKAKLDDTVEALLAALSIGCAAIELAQLSAGNDFDRKRATRFVLRSLALLDFDRLAKNAAAAAGSLVRQAHASPLSARLTLLQAATLVREIGDNAIVAKTLSP